ncbi:MAG: FAD-dependent oxidoreductase [Candidatus Marinimicrobia bacterium]|nr:FAD-dependent oxidoreductase [Candidatus Neomarinimicrobiota bacterium]
MVSLFHSAAPKKSNHRWICIKSTFYKREESIIKKSDVIIIGGGAVGLCTAYYLNQSGFEVTIINEGDSEGKSSCSWGNAGMIVPGHIIPLASPGVFKKGLKWLLAPESPFSIEFKPTLNLISWLWKFRKAANPNHVKAGANTLRALGLESRSLYLELGKKMDFGLENKGIMMLCKQEEILAEEYEISAMARALGIEAVDLDQTDIQSVEIDMKSNALGGVHYPLDCHINPARFLQLMQKFLVDQGVNIVYESLVSGFSVHHGKIKSVLVEDQSWSADYFVLAAGRMSGNLVKSIGLKLPMMGGKGYSVTIKSPIQKPAIPALLIDARIASTPMEDQWRIGGTMTITESNKNINERKLNAMFKSVQNYYPDFDLAWVKNLEPWVGLRPLSADGLPYIGPFGQYPNLIGATGHAMLGISLAPITGQLVNHIISGNDPGVDMSMLSPDRF